MHIAKVAGGSPLYTKLGRNTQNVAVGEAEMVIVVYGFVNKSLTV